MCAGEFFLDLIFYALAKLPRLGEELVTANFGLELGGGAAITASVAARLGRRTELVTVLGSSALDSFAIQELDRRGVGRKLVRRSQRLATAGVTVSVSTKGDRYFLTSPGANKEVASHVAELARHGAFNRAQHVHFGLCPRKWHPFPAILKSLRSRNVTTSWDLGWHTDAMYDPDFRRTLAATDIVFMNQDEALRFFGTRSVENAVRSLRSERQTIVVKLGRRGAMAMDADGCLVRSRAVTVHAIDTTGAGDAFNAGFLHLWLEGSTTTECLRAGNICGGLSTRFPGGTAGAPTSAELHRLMRRND